MKRLSEKEKTVLSIAQLRADEPVSKLRELTGYREHTIRYSLERSKDFGIDFRRCFLNLCLLGYGQYEIFFSLAAEKKGIRERFLEKLIASPLVSWLGELGGDFQYGVNICAKDISEVSHFLDELSADFGQVFLEKSIAIRLSLEYFGNKYLRPVKNDSERLERASLTYAVTKDRVLIDETDHRILHGLTQLTYSSRSELSRLIGIPFSTLEHRIRRLEQKKVIVGFYHHIPPESIGMQSYLLLISIKDITSRFKERFRKFCVTHPSVVVFINTIGSWDFEVAVEVQESADIMRLTQEIHDHFGRYLHFVKVLPCFGYRKIREYPFELEACVPKQANQR